MRPRKRFVSVGERYGCLVVLREIPQRDGGRHIKVECRCDCGNTAAVRLHHLTEERRYCTRSCPLFVQHRVRDHTGKKYGRWTVIGRAGMRGNWASWNCVCECGTERELAGASLAAGSSLSCGCLLKDNRATGRTPEEELEVRRMRSRISNRKNPARVKANKIKYEKKLAQATPSWLSKEDWDAMNAIYEEARRLTRETGINHQVDHIIPLNGKTVSGLHVPANLQILTQAENVAKSNMYAELIGDYEK